MKAVYILIGIAALSAVSVGQSYRSLVNGGNDAYMEKKYEAAEKSYKEGIREKPERVEGYFNLGNTAYRKMDTQAALDAYKNAATKSKDKTQIAGTLYNAGNAYLNAAESAGDAAGQVKGGNDLKMQGYRQAIEAYKQALKLNPSDENARYNLVYAMKKLEQLQNQNQNNNQDKQKKDQKQDKKEDKNEQNKDKQQDQQKKEQQDKQEQQNQKDKDQQQKSKPDEQQSKPQEQKMSKQPAEQILNARERDEKDLQKKVRAQQAVRIRVEKDW